MNAQTSDHPLVTLTTDFGLADGFVGTMKGVIAGINPAVRIIDISHDIPPQDLRSAAFVIQTSVPFFPAHAVHVVVVDPGVGSRRNVLVACTDFGLFLLPDNGILSLLTGMGTSRVFCVENRAYCLPHVSSTFHGRDIFASVAGHLSLGVDVERLGPPTEPMTKLEALQGDWQTEETWKGHVIYQDRFGNLVTNLSMREVQDRGRLIRKITVGTQVIDKVLPFYADEERGSLIAVWGSHGFLEIAVNGGHAGRQLGMRVGGRIWIETQEIG